MSSNPTSSVSLPAIPVAGQLPGTGSRSAVPTANSRGPSGACAVTSASVQVLAPEQYCLIPDSRQVPSPVWLAVTAGPGGWAAQTPQREPAGGGGEPSSARIASASACPSDSLASERSSAASRSSAAQRRAVLPPPGSGRFSQPASTARVNASAVSVPGEPSGWPPERPADGAASTAAASANLIMVPSLTFRLPAQAPPKRRPGRVARPGRRASARRVSPRPAA